MNKNIAYLLITTLLMIASIFSVVFILKSNCIDHYEDYLKFNSKIISEKAVYLLENETEENLTQMLLNLPDEDEIIIEQLLIFNKHKLQYDYLNYDKEKQKVFKQDFNNYEFLKTQQNSLDYSVKKINIGKETFLISFIPFLNASKEIENTVFIFFKIKCISIKKIIITLIFCAFLLLITFYSNLYLNKKNLKIKISKLAKFIEDSIVFGKWPKNQMEFKNEFSPLEKQLIYFSENKKDLEKDFERLQQKFNLLVNQSNDGILIEDINGILIFVNAKLVSMLEYEDAHELMGKKFNDFIYDKSSYDIYNAQTISRKNTKSSRYAIDLKTKSGKKINCLVSGSAHYDEYENITEYYGTISDINLIRHLKDEMMEVETQHVDVDTELQAPLIIINESEVIIDANLKISSILEIPNEELINKKVSDILMDYSELLEILENHSIKDKTYEIFEPYLNKWLFIQVSHRKINSSNLRAFTIIDISHARDIEKYHNYVFNDIDGFIFFTNEFNELTYISNSFSKISGHDSFWFEEYYEKVFQKLYFKEGNLTTNEIMLIFVHKPPAKFRIYSSRNEEANINIFVCNKIKSDPERDNL